MWLSITTFNTIVLELRGRKRVIPSEPIGALGHTRIHE